MTRKRLPEEAQIDIQTNIHKYRGNVNLAAMETLCKTEETSLVTDTGTISTGGDQSTGWRHCRTLPLVRHTELAEEDMSWPVPAICLLYLETNTR